MNTQELVPAKIDSFYDGEKAPNSEMKCPVVLVLDKSSSMAGGPMAELNKGLKIFQTQIQNDDVAASRLDCAVITFGSEVDVVRDFQLFEGTAIETITVGGSTMMVEGIREAMARIEARKSWYKKQGGTYYRPYIVLITDGYPTSSKHDIEEVRKEIRSAVEEKKFNLWAFGVEGADMNFLRTLTAENFPPQKLKGHNFVEFFKWLSGSFSAITSSRPDEKVDLTPQKDENPFMFTV